MDHRRIEFLTQNVQLQSPLHRCERRCWQHPLYDGIDPQQLLVTPCEIRPAVKIADEKFDSGPVTVGRVQVLVGLLQTP